MPFNVRAVLVCLFLSLAAVAQGANVSGTVRDASSHAPLQSMVVQAYDRNGVLSGQATTDATGLYFLNNLAPGDYRLLAFDPAGVYATAFDGAADSFETTPLRGIGSGGATIDFSLVKGGFVAGTVRPGAVVEAYNLSGTRRGFTSADGSGSYTLVLPPGDYKLVAYDPSGSYAPSFWQNARAFADATPVRVREGLTTSIAFTLLPAARVSGTAVDAGTLAPLPSMLVYAYTPAGSLVAQTTTNATGSFTFILPAGTYRFVAADPAHTFATTFYDGRDAFEQGDVLTVAAGEQRTGLQLRLVHATTISGQVNAPGLTVSAFNLDGTLHASTTSSGTGSYSLAVVPGAYIIAVSDPGLVYATAFWGGSSFRSASPVNALSNVGGIDLTAPRAGRITGVVRANGLAVPGIRVAAYDSSGTLAAVTTTAADGRYTLALVPGSYRVLAFDATLTYVTAYAGGATSFETTVPLIVQADGSSTADFNLQTGLRVSGQVSSRGGVALTGIDVFALDAAGNRIAAATSNAGAFTIVLRPGTYRFAAVDPEGHYQTAQSGSVTVSEGSVPSVSLILDGVAVARRRSVRH